MEESIFQCNIENLTCIEYEPSVESDIFVLDDTFTADYIYFAFCTMFVIASCGIVTNVLNLVLFIKQGFKDTMNLSLLALTVSDLCSLLPLYWLGILSDPHFQGPAVLYVGMEAQFLTASWPHTIFARLTSWVTAYIMFERCFCVALPLKVKVVVTPKRVKAVLIFLYVVVLAGVLPTYTTHGLAWRFYPAYNRTMLGLRLSDAALGVTRVTNIITNPLSAISSFAVVLACTIIIATTLSRKARWRESNSVATATGQYHITGKARKAVKMVTILSVIFLISVTPSVISVILTDVSTDFNLTGKYRNIFFVVYSITFILEAVNSSSNFFVYYAMNSKFKSMFHQLFIPKWLQKLYTCRMKAVRHS